MGVEVLAKVGEVGHWADKQFRSKVCITQTKSLCACNLVTLTEELLNVYHWRMFILASYTR